MTPVDIRCQQCHGTIAILDNTATHDFVSVVGYIERAAQHGYHCPRRDQP